MCLRRPDPSSRVVRAIGTLIVIMAVVRSMSGAQKRAARREQQTREVEESQLRLRSNIAEAKRLVDQSDTMLRRHRVECQEDDAAAEGS